MSFDVRGSYVGDGKPGGVRVSLLSLGWSDLLHPASAFGGLGIEANTNFSFPLSHSVSAQVHASAPLPYVMARSMGSGAPSQGDMADLAGVSSRSCFRDRHGSPPLGHPPVPPLLWHPLPPTRSLEVDPRELLCRWLPHVFPVAHVPVHSLPKVGEASWGKPVEGFGFESYLG